ncbi:MAG TPA: phosphoribosyltransferase [Acidimicrobiales bacterium]|nr:phosphoribosyltransferase [Acidimicrobiales bacterium]
MRFRDRAEAGRLLAEALAPLGPEGPVVIGLPRGGVPVAAEVSKLLDAPLDVVVVRKLGHPAQPELGVGAIGEDGVVVVNQGLVARTGVHRADLDAIADREAAELARRVELYRGGRPRLAVAGRTVVLVDDGLATGFTARAAIELLHRDGVARLVLAVPVAPADTVRELGELVDEVVALRTPGSFQAIGQWYEDFHQVDDATVTRCLAEAVGRGGSGPSPERSTLEEAMRDGEVEVQVGGLRLGGSLVVPGHPLGLVVFAHGSGSSRHSPRNRFVAGVLNRAGLATLLFDLLTDAEAEDRRNVFDVELLGRRLAGAIAWCRDEGLPEPIGCFGASTGAAAALIAAAEPAKGVAAVVSRGGRPDLAGAHLGAVTAPTLLVVGGDDTEVLQRNRWAAERLRACEHEVVVVPGATHLFEEPGTLAAAAELARDWFLRQLRPS